VGDEEVALIGKGCGFGRCGRVDRRTEVEGGVREGERQVDRKTRIWVRRDRQTKCRDANEEERDRHTKGQRYGWGGEIQADRMTGICKRGETIKHNAGM